VGHRLPGPALAAGRYRRRMASSRGTWWTDAEKFAADARRADDDRLRQMLAWASGKEDASDAPGTGRSPKGRRLFGSMARIAAGEMERRGLTWG
jgi:hypothetical protein